MEEASDCSEAYMGLADCGPRFSESASWRPCFEIRYPVFAEFWRKIAYLASSGTYVMFSIIIMYGTVKIKEEYYKDSNWENSYAIYS